MKSIILVFLVSLAVNCSVYTQSDTLVEYTSDVIEILDDIQSQSNIEFDAKRSANGMTLLSNIDRSTNLSIRSAGPGLLSTILRRGMASRHLALTWSGFNIQSVVNGTFDVGLIPQTFGKIRLISHDAHATVGNAAVAGAITLDHDFERKGGPNLLVSYGSDQNTTVRASHLLRNKHYTQSIAIELRDHKNRYGYKNGSQRLIQDRGDQTLANFNYRSQLRLSQRVHVNLGAWLQKSKRNIPPTKTAVDSNQYQEDENYRFSLGSTYFFNNDNKLEWRNAGLDFFSGNGLTLSGQYRRDVVSATFFPASRHRDNLSLMAKYEYSFDKLSLSGSVRPQLVDGDFRLGVSGVNVSYSMSDQNVITGYVGQGFTLPSFNDLYWPTGGNPELLSESSVNAEVSFKFIQKENNRSAKITLFYNDIDNWIQWIPVAGRFHPVNQRKVQNVGVELDYHNRLVINSRTIVSYAVAYAYTDSRLKKHYFDTDLEGKKTIFVPAHKLAINVSTKVGAWEISVAPYYYSRRYDTVDNSDFVPGYIVLDAAVSRVWDINPELELRSIISIENGTNNNYENIRFYPMPLAVVRGGVQLQF